MAHSHAVGCGCADEVGSAEPFSLYKFIDVEALTALNADGDVKLVFQPDALKLSQLARPLCSDDDETLIIRVPFEGRVKLTGIVIGAVGDNGPTSVALFKDREIDFSNVEDVKVTQRIDLPSADARAEVCHPVNTAVFGANMSVLTLYFDGNHGDEDVTSLFYIGLSGSFVRVKRKAVNVNYEAVANPQDHKALGSNLAGSNIMGGV